MSTSATPTTLTQICPSFDGDKPIVPGDFGWGFVQDGGDRLMRVVMYAPPEGDTADVQQAIVQRQAKVASRLERAARQREQEREMTHGEGEQDHTNGHLLKGERREIRAQRKHVPQDPTNGMGMRRAEHGPAHVHVIVFDTDHPDRRLRESRFMLMQRADGSYDCELFHKNSRIISEARRNGNGNGHANGNGKKYEKAPDLLDEEVRHIRRHILAHAPAFLEKWRDANRGTALEKQVWVEGEGGALGVPDADDPRREKVTIALESGQTTEVYSTRLVDRVEGMEIRKTRESAHAKLQKDGGDYQGRC